MDFSLNPEATMMRELADQILAEQVTPDRLSSLAREGEWFDRETWGHLGRSGILGSLVPEDHGGAGLDEVAAHLVLLEVGRRTAQVPVWESAVVGASALSRHGGAAALALLPGLAEGTEIVVPAFAEPRGAHVLAPRTAATPTGDGWSLSGIKAQVTFARQASRMLVSAALPGGETAVFLVDSRAVGVVLNDQETVAQRPAAEVVLDAVVVDADAMLGAGRPGAVLPDLLLRARAGLASLAVGVADAALRTTAEYTTGRQQFGQPVATFQSARQRMADAFIDVEAMRLTALRAAWCLAEGRDAHETEEAVAVAKFWTGEGGHRVVHSAQHLHGGMGIDLDYHLHRHYRMAKWAEFTLGTAGAQVREVGARIARAN